MNATLTKIKIPNIYLSKQYNLLYLINTHNVYKDWKTKRVIENIIINLEDKGFDQLSERALSKYIYLNKDNKEDNNLNIKYSYLKELAIELNCTVDDIVEPIENIYKN